MLIAVRRFSDKQKWNYGQTNHFNISKTVDTMANLYIYNANQMAWKKLENAHFVGKILSYCIQNFVQSYYYFAYVI